MKSMINNDVFPTRFQRIWTESSLPATIWNVFEHFRLLCYRRSIIWCDGRELRKLWTETIYFTGWYIYASVRTLQNCWLMWIKTTNVDDVVVMTFLAIK